MSLESQWKRLVKVFFPEMPKDEMMKLMEKMLKYENGLVAAGPCVIFEGVQETIKKLK